MLRLILKIKNKSVNLNVVYAYCITLTRSSGMTDLVPKWVRLSTNGTNPGLFRSDFFPEKVSGFLRFEANVTYFCAQTCRPRTGIGDHVGNGNKDMSLLVEDFLNHVWS